TIEHHRVTEIGDQVRERLGDLRKLLRLVVAVAGDQSGPAIGGEGEDAYAVVFAFEGELRLAPDRNAGAREHGEERGKIGRGAYTLRTRRGALAGAAAAVAIRSPGPRTPLALGD